MIKNKTMVGGSGSTSTAYVYDSLDRLVHESTSTNGSSLFDIHYSCDLAGNRLSKTVDSLGVAYTLGAGNRLASAETIGVIDIQGSSTESIGTDDRWGELWVSNITANVGWVPEIDGYNYWVDNMPLELGTNQIPAAICDHAGNMNYTTNTVYLSATSTNMQYGYDAAGCMTNLNGVALNWDERYRLTSVFTATSSVSYTYDVLGRRISRVLGSTINYFVYDGGQVVADLDASGELLRTYVWGMSIDNLLCFTDHTTSNTYYAIKDHQNSIVALVDENGTIVESYEYDAYGNTKVFNGSGIERTESSIGNRYCFQGREIDWTSGLYYYRARWYDSETGRWLSKDPVGVEGGLNQYVFCGNNPVNLIDPDGLDTYRVNRRLGGTEARSKSNPITHTFIATTNEKGEVVSTYSWGNNKEGSKHWFTDVRGDIDAAQAAIDAGKAKWTGDSTLDPYIEAAYNLIKDHPGSNQQWRLFENCKHHTDALLDLAERMKEKYGCSE